jgi:DNA mismatch repair protein MutS
MFFEDAIAASKTIEIALTGRECGLDERAPMCGIPYHSANNYISRLVENGYKVAICEQVEDPSQAKGIVKRDVTRVVTPGTIMEGNLLENKKNNYLMAVYVEDGKSGIAYVDISTGELYCTSLKEDKIIEEIAKINPSEIISNKNDYLDNLETMALLNNIYINKIFNEDFLNEQILNEYFSSEYIASTNINKDKFSLKSLVILLNYVFNTQKQVTSNINSVNIYNSEEFMILDMFTRSNLELTSTMRNNQKKGSLLSVLDKTSTAMGGRLIRKYIEQPLINKEKIEERLDVIEEIKDDFILREDINDTLRNVYDIERICGKIAFEKVTPKEMINLKNSIEKLPNLKNIILNSNAKKLKRYIERLDDLQDIYDLIDNSILEEPALTIKEGGIIKSEFNDELNELRQISQNGAYMIKNLENSEREKTGIKSLKIGFNKVFGYYIEITKNNLKQLDLSNNYIRKQTLSNAERFITQELKEIEDKVLNAEEKIKQLE